ncbi:MAG: HPP family protein [Janthinobacterium lividum]
MKKRELVVAPLCEAALILVAGVTAWLTHKPLFFASLGPTAFEMIESPERPSARPYNVILGHFIGVLSGFAALALTHAWASPAVSTSSISLVRVWAAVLAGLLTVFGTLLARAQQPAALSTSLMIATGSMQRLQDAPVIMAAILLITALGEPLRRWRLRNQGEPPQSHQKRVLRSQVADQGSVPERKYTLSERAGK